MPTTDMKTLTIGGTTYQIHDETARKAVDDLDKSAAKIGEEQIDDTAAHTKNVPEDAAPYAVIHEIGGAARKCDQLWDEEWALGYYDNSQGGAFVSYTNRFACKNKINVLPNTKYYISVTDTVDICFYNSDEEYIENSGYDSSRCFTTPSDCVFITFNLWITYGTSYKNDIMLNLGSTALPYEPYFEGLGSVPVTAVESVGADGETIAIFAIPAEVQALDGYGEGNPDNLSEYNAICWEDDGWKYHHIGDIVDGAWVTLATPIVTDISDLFPADNSLPVEVGGVVRIINEYDYDVPSIVVFCTNNNELIGADAFVGDLVGTAAKAEVALDVPAWAKEETKPTYTAEEVGAAPAYTYGTTDLTAGSSALPTGTLYFVYE